MWPLVTHCWLRSFWEMIDKYNLHLEMDIPTMPLPRQNDQVIIKLAIALGFRGEALRSINRCRLFLCAIFLSDITAATGKSLDVSYMNPQRSYGQHSSHKFATERPSEADWAMWRRLWQQYCLPDGSLPLSLGKWLHRSHRQWEWYYTAPSKTSFTNTWATSFGNMLCARIFLPREVHNSMQD